MSYKDYLNNNINKLYKKYKESSNLIVKRQLKNRIITCLEDLRIEYEKSNYYINCSTNDV